MNSPLRPFLIANRACYPALEWAGEKSLSEVWATCDRGDWMCWLIKKGNMCDLRTLTLIKARQAELAKPWMTHQASLEGLQAAFDFANGLISEQELAAAAYAAAAYAAYAAAAYAAYAAAYAADAYAAAYAAAAYAAAYAADARLKILAKCADICREVLPNPSINK